MTRLNKVFVGGAFLWLSCASAHANEVSIGLATPSPTGISLKVWFDKKNAFDILGAWSISNEKYYVHFNYLTHDYTKFRLNDSEMPFYYGFGGRIKEEEGDKDARAGIRIPFGISYFLQSAPFDVFGELAPRVDVTPDTNFGLDVMIGIRYRINPNQ
jgi:hypothetical protein